MLSNLEDDELTPSRQPRIGRGSRAPRSENAEQLSIFSAEPHPVVEELRNLDLNRLPPIEALKLLASLKEKYAR